MPSLASLILVLCHALYSLFLAGSSLWRYFICKSPQPLVTRRRRVPSHLAVLLVADGGKHPEETERVYLESAERAVNWCRTVGIERLTLYDCEGVLVKCSQIIRERVKVEQDPVYEETSDSEVEFPLTPPLSDHSDSRPLSPDYDALNWDNGVVTINVVQRSGRKKVELRGLTGVVKRRRSHRENGDSDITPLMLHLVSRESSKPAIASLTQSLARIENHKRGEGVHYKVADSEFQLSVEELNSVLEGQGGLSSPDFMIVHPISPPTYNQTPFELHGFPPWQIRLTEIYHNKSASRRWWDSTRKETSSTLYTPLGELEFREALDEFACAEMRLGK